MFTRTRFPPFCLGITLNLFDITEDYVQTGPNSLYANSRSTLDIDGQKIPFTWNKTVSYDSDLGTMP